MRTKISILSLLFCITGCAINPSTPNMVSIPVAVACIDNTPASPQLHTNAELALMDEYAFISAIHADRLSLIAYTAKLEAILQACK